MSISSVRKFNIINKTHSFRLPYFNPMFFFSEHKNSSEQHVDNEQGKLIFFVFKLVNF